MHSSAASETRLLLPPVTVTSGVIPRRPQVRPFGGLEPWPDSSSKPTRAPRPAAAPAGQRGPAPASHRPPPPVRRHPRHAEPPGHLPVTGPRLHYLRGRQPHLLPAGPLHRIQPATIGVPHDTGIPQDRPAVT